MTAGAPHGSSDPPDFVRAPDAPALLDNPVIESVARSRGCTPAQVLLARRVQRATSAVRKSVTPSRLREDPAAVGIGLGPADLERIAG